MPFRRRRPLLRGAAVAGGAYYAGKKAQERRDEDAGMDEPQAGGGLSPEAIEELKQLAALREQGILTDEEFEEQKQRLLQG
jgi:Short C-terminal domain